MEFKASHRYARMGVRKARLVMDLVRGRTVNQALDTLDNDRHRAARAIAKCLRSAVANALQNPEVRANRLVVSEAFCNEGPLLQKRMRFRPSAMGRALPFRRRTCHIHLKIKDPELNVADEETMVAAPPAPATAEAAPETTAEADAPPTNDDASATDGENEDK